MKINYKNIALGLIDDPDNFNFGFPDPDITPKFTPKELRDFGLSIMEGAPLLKEMCGDNIQYISHSFAEAFSKGFHKLKPLFYNEEINEGGVIIIGGHTGVYTHVHTYYYAVKSIMNGDKVACYDIIFMDFSKHAHSDLHGLDVYVTVRSDFETGNLVQKSLIWDGYINDGKDSNYWQIFILSLLFFKKYCDIETKEVSPKNRRAKVGGNKYINETDKRIKILDATWFTNLVVSGAFMVGDETGGFLRWQHYGPGNSQKKLIWVDPYEKQGYVRKAKALNQNDKQT